MLSSRSVSSVLAALLPVLVSGLLLAPAAAATPRGSGVSVGSPGIGDDYFPLDGNGGYDVAHYSVRDAYDQARDLLVGSTVVSATATERLTRFDLDLLLPVRSVRVDGRPAAFAKRGQHELVVTPARPIARGKAFRTVVRYAGHPGSISWRGESNWLSNGQETVAMNQPHMAPWWFAANDHPLDKATMDVRITARADRQVVSNGDLVSRRTRPGSRAVTHWRSGEPMVPYLAFFALGRYQVRSGVSADGLPFYAAVSREVPRAQRRKAMRRMLLSSEIVSWLESQVGDYPFASTGGLTTSLQPGFALENQTRPTYPVLGQDGELTVVHELAHQWFGDSVAVAGWRDIWLNEGLATFFEARWTETHGGPSAQHELEAEHRTLIDNPRFWRLRIDDPGPRHLFAAPIYQRGAMTIQALRTRLGDPVFSTLLRTWVQQRGGRNASTQDFEQLAAQISGQDLASFFDAWLRTPEPPERTAANGLVS